MEEHHPIPHPSQRIARKLPLPPEVTPIRAKQSRLTESSTSRTPSSSSELLESPILVSTILQLLQLFLAHLFLKKKFHSYLRTLALILVT